MRQFPINEKVRCPCCTREFVGRRPFGTHLGRSHPEYGGVKRYVLEQQLNGDLPTCMCGCDELVSWHKTEYRFVDYVSGHNDIGDVRHIFTETDRKKANDALRVRLADPIDGALLRQKNSESVREAFKDPLKKQNLVEGQKRGWQDEDRRSRRVELNHQMWLDPVHYDKVFTSSMRAKVGVNNMKRDIKRLSKEEQMFVDHLCSTIGVDDVLSSVWMNSETHGTACFDAYIRSHRCYVEYDGVSWHGLVEKPNASERWRELVENNRRNDCRKDAMVFEKGVKLLRVRSDSDWKSIASFEDLIEVSYRKVGF